MRVAVATVVVPVFAVGVALQPVAAAGDDESRSASRFVAGEILGVDLDAVDELSGVAVENLLNEEPVTEAMPLDSAALDELLVDLGGVEVPLGDVMELGVANQWATAEPHGTSSAAAGAVADGEGVGSGVAGEYPADLRLDLAEILGEVIPDVLEDLELELGAISSEAHLIAPDSGGTEFELTTDYEIAGGHLLLGVPAVADVSGEITAALENVADVLDELESQIAELLESLDALDGLLDALEGLPAVTVTGPDIDVDLDVSLDELVDDILSTPIGEGTGAELNLADATLVVDLDQLLEGGLSDQAPNTDLLGPAMMDALAGKLTEVLEGLAEEIVDSIAESLGEVELDISIFAEVSALLVTDVLDLSMSTSLDALISGDAEFVDESTGVVVGVVSPLLGELVDAVVDVIGGLVDDLIFGEAGILATVGETIEAALEPLPDTLLEVVAVVGDLVSVQLNVQAGQPEGTVLNRLVREIPLLGSGSAGSDGPHSVAALRIELSAIDGGAVVLAQSEVGVNVAGDDGDVDADVDADAELVIRG